MIDNDIEKADGELRTMLASMVNEPLLEALRRSSNDLIGQLSDEIRNESAAVVRQVDKKLAGVRDELGEVRSKVAQTQADGAASSHDLVQRLTDVLSSIGGATDAMGQVPNQVRDALGGDFAAGRRELEEAFGALMATSDKAAQLSNLALQDLLSRFTEAEQQRVADRETWMRATRSIRALVLFISVVAALGLLGTAVVVIRSFS